MSLVHDFLVGVETHPLRTALVDAEGRSATFSEVASRSAAFARAWRAAGVRDGHRVLLAMPLGIDLYAALAGLWRLGATVVLPEPAMGLAGLRHAARALRPDAYLSQGHLLRALGHFIPELRQIPRRLRAQGMEGAGNPLIASDPGRPALVSFTSGSTGAPKAIQRTHGFLTAQNRALAPLLEPGRPDEVDLVAFPVFALLNLRQGITSVLPPWNVRRPDRLDPAATLARLRERRVTRLLVPPAALERLQDHSLPRSVGTVFTGGGPVYPDLVDRLSATSPHVRVGCVYGSTEAEPIAHVFQDEVGPADREAMLGGGGILAGIPVPETRVRIVDDEIWVAGDHVVQGYLDPHDDASTKVREDGIVWHRTGDAGRLDGRKRLWLLGRHGSRVSGVYPFQVEVAARSWPGVRRAALAHGVSSPVIAVEGDGRYRDEWRARAAAAFPGMAVLSIRRMPLDRRHRSKVDMAALNAVLRARATR